MSNKSDVGFSIGGELKDAEFILELAREMVDRGVPDFGENLFSDEHDVIAYILETISRNDIVWFGAEDTGDTFEDITDLCVKYGMSYRITCSGGYETLPEVRTWKPSQTIENRFFTDFEDNPVIGVHEMLNMIERDGLTAEQLVGKLKAALPNNDDYKITASDDVLERLRNAKERGKLDRSVKRNLSIF